LTNIYVDSKKRKRRRNERGDVVIVQIASGRAEVSDLIAPVRVHPGPAAVRSTTRMRPTAARP
jgi:hypothetical protein